MRPTDQEVRQGYNTFILFLLSSAGRQGEHHLNHSLDTIPPDSYTGRDPTPTEFQTQAGEQVLLQPLERLAAGATPKEGQVVDEQEERRTQAPRAAFEQLISVLPAPGTRAYWQCIEQLSQEERLPLEVLAHCLRAHLNEGAKADAERIFVVLLKRLQPQIQYWAYVVTLQSRDALQLGLAADLEQECVFALWKELSEVKHTYLLVNFSHTLKRIEQHVAHGFMEQAGQWKRPKTAHPRRIQRSQLDRLEERPRSNEPEEPPQQVTQVADPAAEEALAEVELVHDLNTLLHSFHKRERLIVYDRFWRGMTEDEIAEELHITDRTVRNALKRVLRFLRTQYYEEV